MISRPGVRGQRDDLPPRDLLGASSWVAHATWQEGRKRRQSKRSFHTKKEPQAALTELLAAHRSGTFVAPSRMPLPEFVERKCRSASRSSTRPTQHTSPDRDPLQEVVRLHAAPGRSEGDLEPGRFAVGDGALGFWAAVRDGFPSTREQRCRVHENVLAALPKRLHQPATGALAAIYTAETRADAMTAAKAFADDFVDHPTAVRKITGDPRGVVDLPRLPRRALGPPPLHG